MKYAGTYGGIGYTMAVLLWLIGQMNLDTDHGVSAIIGIKALLITQYLVITVTTPWLAHGQNRSGNVTNILLLTIIPLPLYLALARSADVANAGIWFSQLLAICLAIACYTVTRILLRQLTTRQAGHTGISVLQVLAATFVWASRDSWLSWYLT